jgi:hypothetical protein
LTIPGEEDSLPQRVLTLPAILDTGFNRTLEIDEWHLVHWAGLRKEHLVLTEKERFHEGRKYALCGANIWLHRMPYEGPSTTRARSPLRLRHSRQVRVMAPAGKPRPWLPLLGLTALVENNLRLSIDGELILSDLQVFEVVPVRVLPGACRVEAKDVGRAQVATPAESLLSQADLLSPADERGRIKSTIQQTPEPTAGSGRSSP